MLIFSAVNEENNEANNIKNFLNDSRGKVPDVARYYKVRNEHSLATFKILYS